MRPVSELSAAEALRLSGILFDLDDTLLTHGRLVREAYEALWRLSESALRLFAVTGRPCGWGDVLVRQWPIDGFIAENGAVAVVREGGRTARIDPCAPGERHARRIRLAALVEAVREVVPEARVTGDVESRVSDITWDIGEQMRLPDDRIAALASVCTDAGARVIASSVHLHATYDDADKAKGALALLESRFGEHQGIARYAFIGDSGNDADAFSRFETTFGVANVRRYLSLLPDPPKYVASREAGAGFAEIARTICDLRR